MLQKAIYGTTTYLTKPNGHELRWLNQPPGNYVCSWLSLNFVRLLGFKPCISVEEGEAVEAYLRFEAHDEKGEIWVEHTVHIDFVTKLPKIYTHENRKLMAIACPEQEPGPKKLQLLHSDMLCSSYKGAYNVFDTFFWLSDRGTGKACGQDIVERVMFHMQHRHGSYPLQVKKIELYADLGPVNNLGLYNDSRDVEYFEIHDGKQESDACKFYLAVVPSLYGSVPYKGIYINVPWIGKDWKALDTDLYMEAYMGLCRHRNPAQSHSVTLGIQCVDKRNHPDWHTSYRFKHIEDCLERELLTSKLGFPYSGIPLEFKLSGLSGEYGDWRLEGSTLECEVIIQSPILKQSHHSNVIKARITTSLKDDSFYKAKFKYQDKWIDLEESPDLTVELFKEAFGVLSPIPWEFFAWEDKHCFGLWPRESVAHDVLLRWLNNMSGNLHLTSQYELKHIECYEDSLSSEVLERYFTYRYEVVNTTNKVKTLYCVMLPKRDDDGVQIHLLRPHSGDYACARNQYSKFRKLFHDYALERHEESNSDSDFQACWTVHPSGYNMNFALKVGGAIISDKGSFDMSGWCSGHSQDEAIKELLKATEVIPHPESSYGNHQDEETQAELSSWFKLLISRIDSGKSLNRDDLKWDRTSDAESPWIFSVVTRRTPEKFWVVRNIVGYTYDSGALDAMRARGPEAAIERYIWYVYAKHIALSSFLGDLGVCLDDLEVCEVKRLDEPLSIYPPHLDIGGTPYEIVTIKRYKTGLTCELMETEYL